MSCIDDVLSCYALVLDTSDYISMCTTKQMWSNVSQTTSAGGLSDQITMCHGSDAHLYLLCLIVIQLITFF